MSNKSSNGIPEYIPLDPDKTGPMGDFPTAAVLRSAVKTFTEDFPSVPPHPTGPIRLGALARLTALIGTTAGRETSRNWGPPVERFCRRWLSPGRYATYAPGAVNAGKLQWCAYAVSSCFLEEIEARGLTELAGVWRQIGSGSCETLYHHLEIHGWTWAPGEPLPAALAPSDPGAEGLPATGDLVFYGDAPDKLAHVDIFEGGIVGGFSSVGGNSGAASDRVARAERVGREYLATRVQRYGRVPW